MSQVLQRANKIIDGAIGQVDVSIEVNQRPYKGFSSIGVESAMDEFGRLFEATLTYDSFATFPIKLSSQVSVKIKDEYVFTGYIETVEAIDNSDGSEIRISGRDKLSDIQDSYFVNPITFKAPSKLRDVIFKSLNSNGFNVKNIKSDNAIQSLNSNLIGIIDLEDPDSYGESDVISSEVGENIFEFLNNYAAKRQVLLTSDEFGNVIITRGSGDRFTYKTGLIRRVTTLPSNTTNALTGAILPSKTRQNNILSSSLRYSNEQRFSKYVFISQENAGQLSFLGGEIDVKSLTNVVGEANDDDVRSSRQFVQSMDGAKDRESLVERAIWEANIRRIRSRRYTCSVQGFIANKDGEIWRSNRRVVVVDEKNDMRGELMIQKVSYSYDDGGSVTTLLLTDPDAYTTQANISAADLKTNKSGEDIMGIFR